ncbi:uncharacterized protein LOC126987803 [Eriocheir sinensis]|uniref:uncharacterized protein LOC126987803 n=1 Tax=Eriocheir sinensis TaxID=95602 RepID=UPI0021C8E248|nr:uncharacterized protein LOC126987803 [Eriocheir sinensis]
MPFSRRYLRRARVFWWLCVVAAWAVLGVLQDSLSGGQVGPGSYVRRPWSEDQDPKIPKPPKNPNVLRASVQDDTEAAWWTPERLQQLLDVPTTTCRRLVSLGGVSRCEDCRTCYKDGNKLTCLDPDVRPRPGQCIVYSMGVGGELSWDRAINEYNCSVYAFDMTLMKWTNAEIAPKLHFLDLGLADYHSDETINMTSADGPGTEWETRKAHFRRLEDIRDILDHSRTTLDVLKLDIEYWEWNVLRGLLSSPSRAKTLESVNQIALEIHLDGLRNASAAERVTEARRVEEVLTALNAHGFHLAHTELNTAQQRYAEVRGVVFPLYRESLFLRRP